MSTERVMVSLQRCWKGAGSHLLNDVSSASGAVAFQTSRHLRNSDGLCRSRCHKGTSSCSADSTLQHGWHAHQLPRPGSFSCVSVALGSYSVAVKVMNGKNFCTKFDTLVEHSKSDTAVDTFLGEMFTGG